jgi:excisionase family DNA binding protein
MEDDWITTSEAARLAGYHPQTIRGLVTSGRIVGRKFGPVWQVSRRSLLAYVARQEKLGERRGPKRRA